MRLRLLVSITLFYLCVQIASAFRTDYTATERAEMNAEFSVCDDIRSKIITAAHLKPSEIYSPELNGCEKLISMFHTRHIFCVITLKPSGAIAEVHIDHRIEAPSSVLNKKALDLIRSAGPFCQIKATKLTYQIDLPLLVVNPGPNPAGRGI